MSQLTCTVFVGILSVFFVTGWVQASPYGRNVRLTNRTTHMLFVSVSCDTGVFHYQSDQYSLQPYSIVEDAVGYEPNTIRQKHAACRLFISPEEGHPAYVLVSLSRYKGRCQLIHEVANKYKKRVKCHNYIDDRQYRYNNGSSGYALLDLLDATGDIIGMATADRVVIIREKYWKYRSPN